MRERGIGRLERRARPAGAAPGDGGAPSGEGVAEGPSGRGGARVASAFCPGHVTGFFRICDSPRDALRRGSMGAGVCLSLGALSRVEVRDSGRRRVTVFLNDRKEPAGTTELALRRLLGTRQLEVEARSELQLPVSQGLGMSAAGALSASIALASALRLPCTLATAASAAHCAEVAEGTGLGDVAAQMRGGWEVRLRPGLPPHGLVDRVVAPERGVVVCVTGPPIKTTGMLRDPATRRAINRAGTGCMERFLEAPTLERLFELSLRFARSTGLVSRESLELAGAVAAKGVGLASVSMIGNSVFAVGDVAAIREMMEGWGEVFVCGVDLSGARPVD
ncbi:MAG: pantoate kinase [Thermoplasmatota archaeon]